MTPPAPNALRGRLRGVAAAAALALVLAACSTGSTSPGPSAATPAPTGGSAASPPDGTGTPSATSTGNPTATGAGTSGSTPSAVPSARPLEAVPVVRPVGFADPPPGSGLARYRDQRLGWTSCSQGRQCARVLVPLDYDHPDGTAITLALARKVGTGTHHLGSLFIDPGGPGGSGIDYLSSFSAKGLEDYDVVGFDPRGVGQSTPVECTGADLDSFLTLDISPDTPQEQDTLVAADRDFGRDCLKESGPLLQHVSTVEVARDLDLLRGLVGDRTLSYFGASYGTQIGATYAQLFPARVGRLVLDGAVDITGDTSVSQAQGFERALGAFADWCVARSCSLGHTRPEVLAAVARLWTGLDAKPIAVGSRQLTQQLAVAGVVDILYADQRGYPYLLQALQQAIEQTDGRALLFYADQLNSRDDQGHYGQSNYAFPAIRCLDQRDRGVQGEIAAARQASTKAPTVGSFFGPDLQCALWPVAAVPPLELVGAGAAPIVVIGTTLDPATPYEYAVGMARQLRSGVLVTFKGRGHTAYGKSPCVQKLVVGYLVDGRVPADGSTC